MDPTQVPGRSGTRLFDAPQQSAGDAASGGAGPSQPNEPARPAALPGSDLGPRRAKPGDVILDNQEEHMLMHTGGDRPIAHAAIGTAMKVIGQSTESFADRHQRLRSTPQRLEVLRMSNAGDGAPEAAARIAKGFATERGATGAQAARVPTPYSTDRLVMTAVEPNEWTQASAFRAVRAALRSEEPDAALSENKGTTCDAFVTTSLQAGVIAQALHDNTLPPEARQAIEHIKDNNLHLPGVTHAQYAGNEADRYELISEQASEQLKALMPQALQIDAKTTTVEELDARMHAPDSGFVSVGYANPHSQGVQVLPPDHAAVSKVIKNEEL
jgi:hypothetical protein